MISSSDFFTFCSNGTLLSLLYSASKIALGAIFLATLQLNISPIQPRSQQHSGVGLSWFSVIREDIDVDSLKGINFIVIPLFVANKWHAC
jgi:hypothetical protein